MRHFVLSILIIFATVACFSQNITGVVTDNAGKPLCNAKIMIGGSIQSGTSDKAGHFSIRVKKGSQRLVISYDGMTDYDEKHTVGNDDLNVGTIALSPEYNHADSIHVLKNLTESRAPITYELYDKNYIIERNIVRDIPYILENTTSFVALSEGGFGLGFTDMRIRGICSNAINVTINGIQLTNPETKRTLWHHMPDLASSISEIKITRGAGLSTCGAPSFGASIDLITESPNSKPYGDISVMGGSLGSIKASISAGTGIMKNGFSIDLRMAKLMSNGYIDRSDINHNAVMVSAAWRGKNNSLNANIIYGKQKSSVTMWGCPMQYIESARRFNMAGEYYDENGRKKYYDDEDENSTQTHVQLIYSQKIWGNTELDLKLHYNRDDAYFEEYKDAHPFSNYRLPNINIPVVVTNNGSIYTTTTTITNTDLIRRRNTTGNSYDINIEATHKIGNFINTFGGSGYLFNGEHYGNLVWMQYAGNSNKDYEWYRNKSNKVEFNAFYKFGYTFFDKLSLYADLQYRTINYEMKGFDCNLLATGQMKQYNEEYDYNFFNPKGGINYQITPKMRVYASVVRTNREPSRDNLKNVIGQSGKTIEPETLVDYELGYSYKSKIFSGELNLYYMDYRNQIVPTGEFSQNGYYVMTNVEKSYRSGIELQASVKPHRKLEIKANATFSRNRISDYTYTAITYDSNLNESTGEFSTGETSPAYSPEIIAAGLIRYNIFGNFNLYYKVKYVGKQYIDNTSSAERMLKPYCISGLGIDYEIVSKYVKSLRFKFEVNNLFNTEYSDNAYGSLWYEQNVQKSWITYFPQAGVTFTGGVIISF